MILEKDLHRKTKNTPKKSLKVDIKQRDKTTLAWKEWELYKNRLKELDKKCD